MEVPTAKQTDEKAMAVPVRKDNINRDNATTSVYALVCVSGYIAG
jgi:hypothetical protein